MAQRRQARTERRWDGARTWDVHGYPKVGLQKRAQFGGSKHLGKICLRDWMGWELVEGIDPPKILAPEPILN